MEFTTIQSKVEVEIVEKKSKFIAHLFPVESIEEAEAIVKQTKKKYYEARHNCIAYRILKEDQIVEKFNDDGEPSGTAGAPMLTILQKQNLANVLIVVTRYFGGILLGTGGLVRAYSDSLLKAVEQAQKVSKWQGSELQVTLEYGEWNRFEYYCKSHNILITNVEYTQEIVCKIELDDAKKQLLWEDFEKKAVFIKDMKEINKKYISKSIGKK